MNAEKPLDLSTLSCLHPSQALDLHWRHYKSSLRNSGSHQLNLRRAYRAAENARQYVKGDPVNLIDWKAFARTDQLIIREQHDEASAKVLIMLDAGETMVWPQQEVNKNQNCPTKLEVAYRTAMNIAYVHVSMGDMVEVWFLRNGLSRAENAYKPKAKIEIVGEFDRVAAKGFSLTEVEKIFIQNSDQPAPCDVTYWVGDGLGVGDFSEFLSLARFRRNFVHVLSSMEAKVEWLDSASCYFDDSKGKREFQGSFLLQQNHYDERLAAWLKRMEQGVVKNLQGFYHLFTDQSPIERYQRFLQSPE